MSAIFGVFGPATKEELDRMSARLAHRGQAHASWSPHPNVFLGVRGKSVSSDSPIAFTGSIENRDELLAACGLDAHAVVSNSELFLCLYRCCGTQGIAKIRGQFAAAVWDSARMRLMLFNDPIAVRPLYLARSNRGRYVFASEYKALLALKDIQAQPHKAALQHLQHTKQLYSSGSMLHGIEPLKPGSCIELGADTEPVEHCYRPLKLQIERRTAQSHASALQTALLRATERQINASKSVGLALSAGLDSLVVLAAMRKVAPHLPIHTFTAGPSANDPDLRFAAEVAREFGTVHHEIVLEPDSLPELLPKVVWHMEDPIGREEMVYWYLIAEAAARSNVSTLFCGNLADLLLGGMPRFMVVQAAAQRRWIARPLEEFYNSTQNGHEPKSLLGRLLARLYYRKQPMQPPKVLHAESRREYTRFSFHSGDPLNELLIAGLQGQPNPNATCERLYASAGLSYTSPFYDLDVIDCAFRIPGDLKIRGRWQKYILRQAAKELMPQKLAKRPKGLLRLSRNIKLSEVMHSLAEHYLADDKVRARGLFDVEQVRQVRRRPENATYPEDQLYRLWTLLLTEIWAVTFLDHAGAPADARPQLAALEVA